MTHGGHKHQHTVAGLQAVTGGAERSGPRGTLAAENLVGNILGSAPGLTIIGTTRDIGSDAVGSRRGKQTVASDEDTEQFVFGIGSYDSGIAKALLVTRTLSHGYRLAPGLTVVGASSYYDIYILGNIALVVFPFVGNGNERTVPCRDEARDTIGYRAVIARSKEHP